MMKLTLLVFRGHEVIGEYSVKPKNGSDNAIRDVLSKLKPELSGVVLSEHGLVAHSANLPKDNIWYKPFVLHV